MIQNIASCLFFDFKLNAFIAMHLNDFLATPMQSTGHKKRGHDAPSQFRPPAERDTAASQ